MAEDGSVVIGVKLDTTKADKELARVSAKIEKLSESLQKKDARKGVLSEQLKVDYARLDEVTAKVRALKAELSSATSSEQKTDITERLAEAVAEERRLTAETGKMQTEYDRITGQIAEGTENLKAMQNQAGQLTRQLNSARPFENISGAINNARQSLGKFIKYAIGIRTAYELFRRLKSSIVESVKAFANYDAETKSNINSLRASLDALKLSWGAAFAPILNAVAPLLQKLIGWLASAANAVAQFIAVLTGQSSFKKAIANSNKLAAGVSNAGAAAEKAQKQLMSFDDLEILQDTSSSGGGGGGASGLGADVVEEQLSPWAEKLKEHLTLVKNLVAGIGAALATWTIARFLNQVLGLHLPLQKIAGLALAVGGTVTYFSGFADALNNGVNWDNLASMIGGCTVAALGLGLAFGKTGAAVGLLVGGIGMLVAGALDWIKTGTLSTETFYLLEAGIAAVGVALALIVSPWALLVAGFAAGALAIYKNWNVIEEWWNEKVKPWFTVERWKQLGRDAMNSIKNGLNSIALPKFHFTWETTGYNANFFGKQFTVRIPFPHLDWYSRGGVFDKATMIGVGENGKEAVVPLEKNTEWITLVTDGLLERMQRKSFLDGLAQAFASVPMPAMAGNVVPPNTINNSGNSVAETIQAAVDKLTAAVDSMGGLSVDNNLRLYIDGRELAAIVRDENRRYDRSTGR